MSQIIKRHVGSGGGDVNTLEGNTGGPVGPDGLGNIFTLGDEITTTVSGNPLTNTLTWSTLFNANKVLELVDDFIPSDYSLGQLGWQPQNTAQIIASQVNHPGIYQLSTFAEARTGMVLNETAISQPNFILGGGAIESHYVFSLNVLSEVANRYTAFLGFGDANISNGSGLPPDSGIYFQYSDNVNGGRWEAVCINATVATTTDTGILAVTGFTNFGFQINAAGTNVVFLINGTTVATIATNIPSGLIPFIMEFNTSGNLPGSMMDLWTFRQVLTTAR